MTHSQAYESVCACIMEAGLGAKTIILDIEAARGLLEVYETREHLQAQWVLGGINGLLRYCARCRNRHVAGTPNGYCPRCGSEMIRIQTVKEG